jgi:hypothetical protein
MQLRLEKWYSTENRHEEHFFLADGLAAGYQESAYVFGYNPEIIPPALVGKIKAIILEHFDATRPNSRPSLAAHAALPSRGV